MGMISSYKNKQGDWCLHIDGISFVDVNVHESEDGCLVISPPNREIPKTAVFFSRPSMYSKKHEATRDLRDAITNDKTSDD